MARYLRRPTIADAWQNARGGLHAPCPEWLQGRIWGRKGYVVTVKSTMGDVKVGPDDWVIREGDVISAVPWGVFGAMFQRLVSAPAVDARHGREGEG